MRLDKFALKFIGACWSFTKNICIQFTHCTHNHRCHDHQNICYHFICDQFVALDAQLPLKSKVFGLIFPSLLPFQHYNLPHDEIIVHVCHIFQILH